MKEFLFPYKKVRPIQEALIKQVYSIIDNKYNLIAHAPTGIGKCVGGDTLILTKQGLQKISDLYLKTISTNSLSKKLKISIKKGKIIRKRKSQIYKVKTQTGRTIEVTDDHKFLTINNNLQWKELKQLKRGDYIACSRKLSLKENTLSFTVDTISKLDKEWLSKIYISTEPSIKSIIIKIKQNENLSYKKLAQKIECTRDMLKRFGKKYKTIKLDYALKLFKKAKLNLKSIKIKKISINGRKPIQVPKLNEEFAYFVGLLIGNGFISNKKQIINFSNSTPYLIKYFKKIAKNLQRRSHKKGNSKYDYQFNCKSLAILLYSLGFPQINKSSTISIPNVFFKNKKLLSAVLSGIYDTDGSVYQNTFIELVTKSNNLKNSVMHALLIFGIYPIIKEKYVKGKKYFRIYTCNLKDNKLFYQNIGFKHLNKKKRLLKIIKKQSNPNLDVIPNINKLIKKCKRNMNIPYSRELPLRIYESYAYRFRNPSKEGLNKLIKYFKKKSNIKYKGIDFLNKLANSDIFWDKIISIKKTKIDYVYDATIPETHNFIGNGIILHNTAILGPALKHALEKDLTIFFLTPRHSQHHIAIETLKQIKNKYNLDFTAVDLIGKKHMCPIPGIELLNASEFADYCSGVKKVDVCDFYLNTKKKIKKQLTLKQTPDIAHVEEMINISKQNNMCPFEIVCEKAKNAKVIIADYFHILSFARETLLKKINKKIEHSILIFDEAHNLPDKCRDILTVNLTTITIDRAIREAKKFDFKFTSDLEELKTKLHSIEFPLDKQEILAEKFEFKTDEDLTTELKLAADEVLEEQKRSSIASVAHFLESWPGPDEGYTRILSRKTTKRGKQFMHLSYKCLDPSFIFDELKPHSLILMSGTLSPTEMYQDLLDLDKNKTLSVEYKSSFPQKNRLNLIVPTTTTKYTARSEKMYEKIADTCASITNLIPGLVNIYFPSYKLRDEINKYFQPKCNKTIFSEQSKLNKQQKQELIDNFKKYKEQGAVLLGAATGSLGEGIDLPGLLKAVIVVGLPLAKPDLETQQLINYYQERFQKGWDYGYIYPAIIKSLQNAGRCIRSETDRGVIIFLDERYTWQNYKKCFPPDLKTETVINPEEKIKNFFNQSK